MCRSKGDIAKYACMRIYIYMCVCMCTGLCGALHLWKLPDAGLAGPDRDGHVVCLKLAVLDAETPSIKIKANPST